MFKLHEMSDKEISLKVWGVSDVNLSTIEGERYKDVARAAQADALRQVIKYAKKIGAVVKYQDDFDIDIEPTHEFFVDLQSALDDMEKKTPNK